MARPRGFFAELQHQQRLADQRHQAVVRSQIQVAKRAEQAQRAAERARAAAARASEQDRKRFEREASQAHAEARQAEVDAMNAELQAKYAMLDGLLAATLEVDDFIDLESLRAVAQHPPFEREDLRTPIPAPIPIPDPPLPVRRDPEQVKGLFGRKQKAAEAAAAVEQQYATDYWAWKSACDDLPARRAAEAAKHSAAEQERQTQLAAALAEYQAESAAREKDVADQNAELDELIAGLGYGTVDAVQEYVSIVLANSVYPEGFDVTYGATFEPTTAELSMKVVIPGPDAIPTVKTHRYTKSTDEITPVAATQKDMRERYAGIVHGVALRSMHEVFEADRRGLINNIALELGTHAISPATGQSVYVPFVAVATTRDEFAKLDLSAVVPAATLEHLGAAVSKAPHALTPASTAGVRKAR